MELRRIGAISLAKISASIYALFGLLIGSVVSVVALIAGSVAQPETAGPFAGFYGVAAVIVLPLFYGAAGFVGSLIMAGLYNWLAGVVGGVRLEFQPTAEVSDGPDRQSLASSGVQT